MENNNERKHMVLAGIAGLLVGFLVGWLWVDTGEETDTKVEKDTDQTIDLDTILKNDATEKTDSTKTEVTTPPPATPKPVTTTPPPVTVAASDNKITVETQTAGKEVKIGSLSLTDKFWVVVHEDDHGKPLRILGAKSFAAGTHTDVAMKLLRETVTGQVYYAMLHSDDGDGKFDSQKDMPVTESGGAPIMVRFEVR